MEEEKIEEISEKEFENVEQETDKKETRLSQMTFDEKLERYDYDKNNIISSILKDDIVSKSNKLKKVRDFAIILVPNNKRNRMRLL